MLVLAKRKLEAAYAEQQLPLDNVRIMIDNIMYLRECFAETDRLDRIYINFCNPWPRGKHKKRRLTHPRQLVQYRMLLDLSLIHILEQKKMTIDALMEQGKATGKLTTKEITDVLDELDFDTDQLRGV